MKKIKLSLRSWLTLITLIAIGFLGNVYHVPLFFGEDFLFGSIAVLIILQCYGVNWGLISAFLISSYTYFIWGHPYGVLIFFTEALWLGWFLKRHYPPNLVWYDILYWGILGIPLTIISLIFILHIESKMVWLIALKLAINGIFNALWASLLITYTPVGRERVAETCINTISFRQTIYNVLATFVLSISLAIMAFNTYLIMQEVEENAQRRLTEENKAIKVTIHTWFRQQAQLITLLAEQALQSFPDANALQENLNLMCKTMQDFLWLSITDKHAVIATAGNAPSDQSTLFERLKTSEKRLTLDLSTNDGLLIRYPIQNNQQPIGYVQGALDLTSLSEFLIQKRQHIGLQVTLLDGRDQIILSTVPSATSVVKDEIMHWQKTFLSQRAVIDEVTDWEVIVSMPLAYYQHNLYALYLKNLLIILFIILLTVWLVNKISQRMVTSLEKLSIISANLTNYFSNPQDITWPQSMITEVNILVTNFKKMAQYLQDQFDAVEERSFKLAEITIQLQEKILERQETELSLKRAKESAEVANRAKSTFLANMSHELRTPLNGILGYTQILGLDKALTAKQREGIDIIHRSGEHLLTLINDILDLSKIEAGKLELNTADFHFHTFLKDIVDLFRMRAQQKGVGFVFQGQEDNLPVAVHADEKRLRQVLLNLLGNAVKFTEQGQFTFTVRSERLTESCRIHFAVEDSGQGIAQDHLETIFLPFQQVGDSRQHVEGTGLGLPISRNLVELMGGKLQVTSTLNQGSKFWFEIELPEVSGLERYETTQQVAIIGFRRKNGDGTDFKILVVDDLKENRTVLTNLLVPLGFTVQEAINGEEALIKAHQCQPHLIIMDLRMPIMDGLTCTRHLRQESIFDETVILTVTASAFEHHQQESLAAGSNDFLAKPVVAKQLFQLMQVHCGLEWIYEPSTQQSSTSEDQSPREPLIIPPPDIIHALLKLAQSGDVQGITEAVADLANKEETWQPFLNEVQQLAKNFKMKKLRELLKKQAGL